MHISDEPPSERAVSSRLPARPLSRRVVLIAFVVGLALQLVQALAVGDGSWVGHHAAQFAAGAVVWTFAGVAVTRAFVRAVVLGVATLLPVVYLAAVFGWAPSFVPAGGWRSSLWWDNPHLFGVMLASTAALASIVLTRARWFAVVLWVAAASVTIALWSRGPTVAIALGAATWTWTRFGGRGRLWIAGAFLAVSSLLFVSVVQGPDAWTALFGERTVARFVDGSVVDPTGRGGVFARLRAHEGAWTIVRATWPWGAGVERYGDAYTAYVDPDTRAPLHHAHHQLLHFLAIGGPLGLLAWLVPLAAAVWGLGARGWWTLAPFAAVQAFAWGTEAPFLNSAAFYATWIALGLARQAATGAWAVQPPCERRPTASLARPPRS